MLLAAGLFLFSPGKFPADDGFFYLQIAHNIASGNGITFHEISDTNGFHPLWQAICAALAFLVPGAKGNLIYAVWAVQILLFWGAIAYLPVGLEQSSRFRPTGVSFLALVFLGMGTLYLTEAFLTLFLLVRMIFFVAVSGVWQERVELKISFLFGFVAGLLLLSRLDNVFVITALSLVFFQHTRSFRLLPIASYLAGGSLVVVPYLAWNYLTFGHLLPISGVIKSSFPIIQESGPGGLAMSLGIFCLGYLAFLLLIRKEEGFSWRIALCIGSLIHLLYISLFQGATAQWYWVSQYIVVALLLTDVVAYLLEKWIDRFLPSNTWKMGLVVLMIVPAIAMSWLKLRYEFSFSGVKSLQVQSVDPVESFAKELNKRLPAGTAILVYDTPGKLAWYSDLRIIPTDGLVNDYAYEEALSTTGIQAFMQKHEIRYLLTPWQKSGPFSYHRGNLEVLKTDSLAADIRVFSPLSQTDAGGFSCSAKHIIWQASSPLATWHSDYDQVVLWEIGSRGGREKGNLQ